MSKKPEIDPDKLRTMVRSILPSTARRNARIAKRMEQRRARRTARVVLRTLDSEFETERDLRREADLSEIVQDRRAADKLNHFMRWGDAHTRGMTRQQALDRFRALVPRNLIGDHAMSHWESYVRYRRNGPRVGWRERGRRHDQSWHDRTVHRLKRLLAEQPDAHGRLNHLLKMRAWTVNARPPWGLGELERLSVAFFRNHVDVHDGRLDIRLLAGVHDVERFVTETRMSRGVDTYSQRIAFEAILDYIEKSP